MVRKLTIPDKYMTKGEKVAHQIAMLIIEAGLVMVVAFYFMQFV